MTPTPAQSYRPFAAALWMAGAIASFTTLAVAGRAVSPDLDTFEIMLYRSIIGLVIVMVFAQIAGTWPTVRAQRMGLHFARNLSHFAGQNLWFYAITVLPLAQVFAMEFTTPIWGLLLAPLILGERIGARAAMTAGIGFVGILIVTRPGSVPVTPGLMAAAACAVGFAISIMLTKRLTRTESLTAIMFWLNLMQLGFALVAAGIDGAIALPPLATLHWMVLIGLTGLSAHACLTRALQLAPASIVMPMDFIRLPVITLVGVVLYGEGVDLWVLLGGALIFLGNWINLRGSRQSNLAPAQP